MNTLSTKKTVTRTVALSNGEAYNLVASDVDHDQMARMIGDARSLALSHEVLVIRQNDGSSVYVNPSHIVSVTFNVTEAF